LVTAVAEFTRKIPMRESGKKVSLFVALATGVLPLLTSSYALLAMRSNLTVQQVSLAKTPVLEVLEVLPAWTANVVLYSGILTLVIWAASWMYATSVSLTAVGIKLRPALSQPIIWLVSLGLAAYLTTYLNFDFLAVIILAWAGIFAGDVALRKISYHEVSLVRDYGFYRGWNLVNLIGFLIAVSVGFGLTSSTSSFWTWLGFISDSYSSAGIYIAALISFLFPILFGRKRIRTQEDEVLKIEARRHDLVDVDLE
jgi:hypothetical protein